MAELAYNVAENADQTHTVTRATGTSVLGAGEIALVTFAGSLTVPRMRAALRAAAELIRRDAFSGSDPADYPTSGSETL